MSEGGRVKIDIENYVVEGNMGLHLEAGRYVCTALQDDGKGIREENLSKIFDPYFSTKDTYSQRGMGLGLSICYAILKKHGGHIFVESKLGIGTRVCVYLPAVVEETRTKPSFPCQ
jgi:two-component system cell cycle sensor histidine kinase/response regulator CckA